MGQQKRTSKFKSSKYEAPKQRRITKQQIANATYKDVKLLEKFISDRGKILPARITSISTKKQRELSVAIKRARFLALLPYINKYNGSNSNRKY